MRRRQRRGFMTIVAVFMVGLVTAAAAVVAATTAADHRRTRATVADVQLRQLLLAAGVEVAGQSASWGEAPPASWSISVPAELHGYTVKVATRSGSAGTAELTVTAVGDGRHAAQRMIWGRIDGQWRVASVELLGS